MAEKEKLIKVSFKTFGVKDYDSTIDLNTIGNPELNADGDVCIDYVIN